MREGEVRRVAGVVLGSINLDLIARIERVPGPGETCLAEAFQTSPGGKGANQALAARRLGAPTHLLGMVGDDAFAMQALRYLRQDGVDLSRIAISKERSTGLALIGVEPNGQNAITVVPGANSAVGTEVLTDLARTLTARDILVLQCEIPLEVVERAMMMAREIGARVLWDPAPARARFPKSLFRADIVAPNQGEAEMILGMDIPDVRAAKNAARQLRTFGAQVGIVKLGEQGVVWSTARGLFYLPAEQVEAIDTVGAGDAFAGALAARLDAGASIGDAIRTANRAAAASTTRVGAQASFVWAREVGL